MPPAPILLHPERYGTLTTASDGNVPLSLPGVKRKIPRGAACVQRPCSQRNSLTDGLLGRSGHRPAWVDRRVSVSKGPGDFLGSDHRRSELAHGAAGGRIGEDGGLLR